MLYFHAIFSPLIGENDKPQEDVIITDCGVFSPEMAASSPLVSVSKIENEVGLSSSEGNANLGHDHQHQHQHEHHHEHGESCDH